MYTLLLSMNVVVSHISLAQYTEDYVSSRRSVSMQQTEVTVAFPRHHVLEVLPCPCPSLTNSSALMNEKRAHTAEWLHWQPVLKNFINTHHCPSRWRVSGWRRHYVRVS